MLIFFFFFNDTATTEIYTLSLHDALPILPAYRALLRAEDRVRRQEHHAGGGARHEDRVRGSRGVDPVAGRSEEHTSELPSRPHLVCRLLLGKKKKSHL